MEKYEILGIAGSLRKGSYNKMLLQTAMNIAPENLKLTLQDIGMIPPYNQDLDENMPQAVLDLKASIRQADGILIATPEYNYGVPGVLKNAIDWASRPYGDSAWNGKVVALMGASTGGFGTVRAQLQLRQSFIFLNVTTLNQPEVYISNVAEKFDSNGSLIDAKIQERVQDLLAGLILTIKKNKAP